MTIDRVSEEHSAGNCCFKLKIMQLKEKIGFIIPSVYSMEKIKPMGKKKKKHTYFSGWGQISSWIVLGIQ